MPIIFLRPFLVALLLIFGGLSSRAQSTLNAALPDLSIELGQTNRERGLSVPNEGDGQNVPETIAGSEVRRMVGPQANVAYLYLQMALLHESFSS